jgi:hypothetical protein
VTHEADVSECTADEMWCDLCEEEMSEEGDNPLGVCAACWAKHEAEQAVLDASGACPEHRLREVVESLAPSNPFRRHAEAELARRGLKPWAMRGNPELAALETCIRLLVSLDVPARARVLEYLARRFA